MADADPSPRGYVEGKLPRSVPEGRVLVHNHVRHEPDTPTGVNGFRAWTVPVDWQAVPLVECDCGWAPLAGAHYRVDRERPHGQCRR